MGWLYKLVLEIVALLYAAADLFWRVEQIEERALDLSARLFQRTRHGLN